MTKLKNIVGIAYLEQSEAKAEKTYRQIEIG